MEEDDLPHDTGSLSQLTYTLSAHELRHADRHKDLIEGHVELMTEMRQGHAEMRQGQVEMVTEMRQMKSTMDNLAAQLTRWLEFQMNGKERRIDQACRLKELKE